MTVYFDIITATQDVPGEIQTQKESLQRVEARTGILGGMQRNCPGRQESDLNMAWYVKGSKNSYSRYVDKKDRPVKMWVLSVRIPYYGYSGYGEG